jgi:hypothetical protein
MPFIPFANTAFSQVRYTLDGQQVMNTLWWENVTAWDAGSLADLTSAIADWASGNLMPIMTSTLSLREVFARDMSTENSFEATNVISPAQSGGAGPGLPNNVSLCISMRSSVTGRSQRGRNYLPGIPADQTVGVNLIDPDYVASILDVYAMLLDNALFPNWTLVVASRFHNNAPRLVGQNTPIASFSAIDNVIDSQRRRLPGRGA